MFKTRTLPKRNFRLSTFTFWDFSSLTLPSLRYFNPPSLPGQVVDGPDRVKIGFVQNKHHIQVFVLADLVADLKI